MVLKKQERLHNSQRDKNWQAKNACFFCIKHFLLRGIIRHSRAGLENYHFSEENLAQMVDLFSLDLNFAEAEVA